jgi:GAF domain-containing protein
VAADRPNADLADTFAGVARVLLAEDSLDATLERVAAIAVEVVPGCAHSGISFVERGTVATRAASDDLPHRIDSVQYETGEGPCLDAIREHEVVWTDDLDTDERWPAFTPRAVELGIRSMLSFRLFDEKKPLGALNLYAPEDHAFDDDARSTGTVLSAHASVAIVSASDERHLRAALENRDLIGQAKGMLMATEGLSADEAFDRLLRCSQHLNRKLVDVAGELTLTGELPGDAPATDA